MSAPLDIRLSALEIEILGALLGAPDLREIDGGWRFVDDQQDQMTSGIGHDEMSKLFRLGLISYGSDGRAAITDRGEMALSRSLDKAISAILRPLPVRGWFLLRCMGSLIVYLRRLAETVFRRRLV
jgi:hypothetical protein